MKFIVLVMAMMILTACSQAPTGNAIEDDTIVIGAMMPLSGTGAFWGLGSQKGIMFAVEHVNEAGGINGKKLEVIYENTLCDPKQGVSIIQKFIKVDKLPVVIGAICSSVTTATGPVSQANGVVQITPCSEAPQISDIGDYMFRTWTPNNLQARTMAEFAYNDLGVRKIGIFSINNDFGESLAEAFEEEFTGLGGEIVGIEKYDQDRRDFRSELTKLDGVNPDAIYMTSYPPDGVAAIEQMAELGMDVQILGSSSTHSKEEVFEPLGGLAEGMYLSDLEDSTTAEFRARYEERFNEPWPGMISCTSVAYDDVMLLSEAFKEVGTDPEKVKDWLAQVANYPGVSGPLTFDENGDLDRQHVILVVRGGEAVVLE